MSSRSCSSVINQSVGASLAGHDATCRQSTGLHHRRPITQHGPGPEPGDHGLEVMTSDLLRRQGRPDGVQSSGKALGLSGFGEPTQSAVVARGGGDELAARRTRCEIHTGKSA